MGDPDLSAPDASTASDDGGGKSAASGRGLVVFPAVRPRETPRAEHWIGAYLPFLSTLAVGAVVVLIVAVVIGR